MLRNNKSIIDNGTSAFCFVVLSIMLVSSYVIKYLLPFFDTAATITLVSVASFFIPAIVFLAIKKEKGSSCACFKLAPAFSLKFLVAATFLLVSVSMLCQSIVFYIFSAKPTAYSSSLAHLGFWQSLFYYAALPAVLEELVFRGAAFFSFEQKLGGIGAIFATSLFFAAIHFSLKEFFSYFFLGAILGIVVYVTRSVFAAMLLHFANNLISFYLEGAVFKIATEAKSGIPAIFVLASLSLLFLFWLLLELEAICGKKYNLCRDFDENQDEALTDKQYKCPRLLRNEVGFFQTLWAVLCSPFLWASAIIFLVAVLNPI